MWIIGVPVVLFVVACLVWYFIGKWNIIDVESFNLGDEDEPDWS